VAKLVAGQNSYKIVVVVRKFTAAHGFTLAKKAIALDISVGNGRRKWPGTVSGMSPKAAD